MNRTERIKADLVGKRVVTNPITGEKLIIDFDDTENVGIYEGEESKALSKLHGGQKLSLRGIQNLYIFLAMSLKI